MSLFKNVTVAVAATDVITTAEFQSAPLELKNKSDVDITLTATGSTGDTYVLEARERLLDVPGNVAITATVASGTAQLVVLRAGINSGEEIIGATAADPIFTSPIPAIGTVVVVSGTGIGAIPDTTASTKRFRLICVTCHLDAAPTTSEDFVVTLDALDGAAYDTVLMSVDPSLVSATDVVYIPDGDLIVEAGDQIAIAYTNTDGNTYGTRIVIEEY